MDAFYASVEQRDFPELKGKPIAVGGSKERGVVAAASYEARKYGVYSAMSSKIAYQKCPGLIFRKPRFDQYKAVSLQIRAIFARYTDLIEPLALDEAFLDVTENKIGLPSATLIAKEIKAAIFKETQLVASAGISVNKFVAKVATDMDKPNGLYVVQPDQVVGFIEKLPIEKFFGIGKVTAAKMKRMGVFRGKDLNRFALTDLESRLGKLGKYLYHLSRGEDHRPVVADRLRKSIGAERTYDQDIEKFDGLEHAFLSIAQEVFRRLSQVNVYGKTITIKLKFSDFSQITRSRTLAEIATSEDQIYTNALELIEEFKDQNFSIRLVGVSISNLNNTPDSGPLQLTLGF